MSMHFGDESVGLSWDRQHQQQHQQQSHLSNRASAASDLEQEPEEVVLDSRRTFYVHDTLACPREEDPKEDQILFFHPAELPMMKQVALMDGIEGFSTFVKEFGMSPPKVITLEHEKAACMHVGQYTLSLCAPPEEPDTSLINQLHNLYSAFVFLHGSFDRVLKKAKNDKLKFREDIRNIWKRLTPLIRRTDTMSFTFQPVRFTELKRSANRHFIAASQILQMVKHRSGVLSGCIFFNKTILCSHLDPATTFWIHLLYDIIHPYASLGDVESTHQLMPVYLKKDIMTQLRVGARKTPEAKAGSTRIPEDFAPDEHGEYVGLYLQVLPRSTLVVVMELAAIYDLDLIHDMTESFVPRLKRLEEQVSKATEAGNIDAVDWQSFMVFDRVDRSIHLPPPAPTEELQLAFQSGVSLLHESFENNDKITAQILCNPVGAMYSSKCFGRETYLQIPGGEFTIGPELLDMSRLEPAVAHRLSSEHQISLP